MKCGKCDFTTGRAEELARHIRSVHLKIKSGNKCPDCDFVAITMSSLIPHIKARHSRKDMTESREFNNVPVKKEDQEVDSTASVQAQLRQSVEDVHGISRAVMNERTEVEKPLSSLKIEAKSDTDSVEKTQIVGRESKELTYQRCNFTTRQNDELIHHTCIDGLREPEMEFVKDNGTEATDLRQTETGTMLKCPHCPKEVSAGHGDDDGLGGFIQHLDAHMKTAQISERQTMSGSNNSHNRSASLMNQIMDANGTEATDLEQTETKTHAGIKIKCPYCPKEVSTGKELGAHMKIHNSVLDRKTIKTIYLSNSEVQGLSKTKNLHSTEGVQVSVRNQYGKSKKCATCSFVPRSELDLAHHVWEHHLRPENRDTTQKVY